LNYFLAYQNNECPPYSFLNSVQFLEKLLVSHRAPPQVADRGTLTRYVGYRGNKISGGGPKLALLPCSFILIYQGLEEENLDKNHLAFRDGG